MSHDAPERPPSVAPLPDWPAQCVVLLVGLPGAGKSSYLARHHLPALSSDELRRLLFDDPGDQRFPEAVFSILRHALRARLGAGIARSFVDATNLTPAERQPLLAIAAEFGYPACALFFDLPLEVCLHRNAHRERCVPEDVVRRMAARLRPPQREEGFAHIDRISDERGAALPFTGYQ
mgnify:CR=1 FL=1